MKQILQSLKNGNIELAEVPVPQVRPGFLLIKSSRSLISLGTEKMLMNFGRAGWVDKARQQPDKVKQVFQKIKTDGLIPTVNAVMNKLDQPLALGYSNAGTVIAVGSGVYGFKPGDRVVSNGNHAEIVCISTSLCARIPDNVNDTTASFTVVSSIALQGVRLVSPTLGESIAVIGLGLIGLITCQILQANGCRVTGFDYDSGKVELARSYGVAAYDLSTAIDPVETAITFSNGHGVDAVIITAATSSNDPIQQAPQMCRKRGRVVLVGVSGLNISRDDFYKKEISFQVSCSYGPGRYEKSYEEKGLDYPIGFVRWTEQRNFLAILDLMSSGKLNVEKLVSREIDFFKADDAYQLINEGKDLLGIVLKYDGNVDLQKKSIIIHPARTKVLDSARPVTGFIGAGNYASAILIPAFSKAGATLKTITSAGGVSGTHVGHKHGFSISATDNSVIFNDPEINTAVISTRHSSHAGLVIEAIRAGKNVFVEKPLCMSLEELNEIRKVYNETAVENGTRIMVGFNRRFSPLIEEARKCLKTLSEPMSVIITVNAGIISGEHWTQDKETGGGRIIGEACHFIDLIRYLTGHPVVEIKSTAMFENSNNSKPADTVTITMSHKNGSTGTVHYFANGCKEFPKERIEVFAAGRILQIDNYKNLNFFGWPGVKNISLWSQDKGQENCAKAFIEGIKNGHPSPISIEEIFEVAELTIAAAKMRESTSILT